jgi:PAS domain-containing protein
MEAVDRPNHCLLLNVGVVVKKAAYLTVIRDLQAIWHSHLRFKLVAMATISSSTVCNKYAGEAEIKLFTDPMALLEIEYLDLILELTGDANILAALIANKPQTMGVLDRTTAMLFFDIAALSNQMAEQQQEITLATSFASALLEASPDGVLVINRDNRIVNCNNSPLIGGGIG